MYVEPNEQNKPTNKIETDLQMESRLSEGRGVGLGGRGEGLRNSRTPRRGLRGADPQRKGGGEHTAGNVL